MSKSVHAGNIHKTYKDAARAAGYEITEPQGTKTCPADKLARMGYVGTAKPATP